VRESGPRVQAPTPIQHPWDPSRSVVPPLEGKTRFHDLDLPSEMMHALADLEFQYCTPVQAELMPKTLQGLDATGRAQTGTGKTAAFLLTIFTLLLRKPAEAQRKPGTPRALILAPTRELVMQIEKDALALGKYCPGIRALAIFGGTDYAKQKRKLEQGPVDIIVATPGRLLDFKSKGGLMLSKVEVMVIDEADRMLDMGFIPDVRRIIESTPPKTRRQTLLFSATLTPEVVRLASKWTKDAITVEIDPEHVATDSVDQVVYIVTADEKFRVLYNTVTQQKLERVIVFCNRRDESQRLAERFAKMGVSTGLLSGDVSQDRRIKTLEAFRSGQIRVMVATDVAARGLHIEDISHVVNYYMPLNPEDYVHRIGRTGRAGAKGISVSFADEMGAQQLPAIEKYMGRPLTAVYPDQSLLGDPVPLKDSPAPLIIEKAVRHEDRNRRRTGRPQGRRPGGSGPHRRRPGGAGGGEGKQGA
jgi:ATP-dependent RNA helicase RhlB